MYYYLIENNVVINNIAYDPLEPNGPYIPPEGVQLIPSENVYSIGDTFNG